ncbi:MAG TPA: PAS domain S-box protein, partial [Polyangiaceae bacterium]|nr:PAS domain S-box protein [Polyangiaceae bacterium]
MSGGSDVALAGAGSVGAAASNDAVYREIFDVLEDAVFVHEVRTGRIVDVNTGASALFGVDRAGLLASSIGALSAEAEGYTEELAQARIAEAVRSGKTRFDWRSKRADGSAFWSEVRLVRSDIGGYQRVLAIVRDISAFRAATETSKLIEERYRVLVRSMPNSAVVLCDHNLRIVLVDGPEVKASGMSKEAMEGRTIWEAFSPEFATLIEGNMRRMLAGESFSAELPFEDRWFVYNYVPLRNDAGEVLYGLILAHNVTERRLAEDALRASELRLAKIFQSSPDAIGVSRRSDGLLLQVNPSFERLLGWSQAEAVGTKSSELA